MKKRLNKLQFREEQSPDPGRKDSEDAGLLVEMWKWGGVPTGRPPLRGVWGAGWV